MRIKNFVINDNNKKPVGIISIYRIFHFNKLTKFEFKEKSRVLTMLKKEQFENLDNLMDDTLSRLEGMIEYSRTTSEKIRYQNKYDGLSKLKKKINMTKNEYLKDPNNALTFNRLINLYNSSKNFL